ncbi:MAG: PilZ domain-containing protein [Planctomycetota bacterium]|nr:PilZ domain-containing protein [Planctomycetota bacterium]
MSSQAQPICDLRLSPDEIGFILDELDRNENEVADSKRRSERFRLRGMSVIVTVKSPDENTMIPERVIRVRLRNVSQHGFEFLSGIMLPRGANLMLKLPIGDGGGTVEKWAVVRRCRHINGMVHEVGAEFGREPGG